MTAQPPTLTEEVTAAIEWWRSVGVEYDFVEEAVDWLEKPTAAPASQDSVAAEVASGARVGQAIGPAIENAMAASTGAASRSPSPSHAISLLGDNPPATIEAFQQWWMSEPALGLAGKAARLPPRGTAGAALMVLVVSPEREDRDTLLSGPQGRLLEKIVAAMGLEAENELYLASAVPQALDMADGGDLVAAGFGEILAHHVALVSPQRLLVFGANALPLLGHDAAQQPESLEEFSTGSLKIPSMVSEGLDAMMAMPRLKARFWRRWLEWTDGQVTGEA